MKCRSVKFENRIRSKKGEGGNSGDRSWLGGGVSVPIVSGVRG